MISESEPRLLSTCARRYHQGDRRDDHDQQRHDHAGDADKDEQRLTFAGDQVEIAHRLGEPDHDGQG